MFRGWASPQLVPPHGCNLAAALAVSSPLGAFALPCQVNFLLLTSVGVLLPLRLHLPLHLAFLLLTLRASAQRCRAECGLAHAAGHGPGAPLAFQPYYAAVVRRLRRLGPRMPWQLSSRWPPPSGPADSCLSSCFAVHAFLQVGSDGQVYGV